MGRRRPGLRDLKPVDYEILDKSPSSSSAAGLLKFSDTEVKREAGTSSMDNKPTPSSGKSMKTRIASPDVMAELHAKMDALLRENLRLEEAIFGSSAPPPRPSKVKPTTMTKKLNKGIKDNPRYRNGECNRSYQPTRHCKKR